MHVTRSTTSTGSVLADATLPPGPRRDRGVRDQRVSAHAVAAAGHHHHGCIAAPDVFAVRDGFEVVISYAGWIPAQVVQLQSGRNRPVRNGPQQAMGHHESPLHADHAVAEPSSRRPYPAGSEIGPSGRDRPVPVDLRPGARQQRPLRSFDAGGMVARAMVVACRVDPGLFLDQQCAATVGAGRLHGHREVTPRGAWPPSCHKQAGASSHKVYSRPPVNWRQGP